MRVLGQGLTDGFLSTDQAKQIVHAAAAALAPAGRRVLVIIPDHTRTCPLGLIARELHAAIAPAAAALDFLVALGTHPPLSEEQLDRLLEIPPGRRSEILPGSKVLNHRWRDPDALATLGTLRADQIAEITGGLFAMDIDVTINRAVFDYDVVLVAGPVFPHEVVGFSGGAKYFFPGICGKELLDFFHWLGAVITNPKIIGTKHSNSYINSSYPGHYWHIKLAYVSKCLCSG